MEPRWYHGDVAACDASGDRRTLIELPPSSRHVDVAAHLVTGDRFDDWSGDAYRLCFRDDVLVSRDTVTP